MTRAGKQTGNQNRQKILDVTSQLITQKGVSNTSVSDIVEMVGISRGTLHYYFPSKSQLISEVTTQQVNHLTTSWLEKIASIETNDNPQMLLKEIIEDFVNEGTNTLNLYLLYDAVTGNEELLGRFKDKYKQWLQVIQEILDKVLSDSEEDNAVLAHIILAVIDGLTLQGQLGIGDIPAEQIAQRLLKK
ncbi:MAG: TetR/AcrR family transcriptional regulator [Bacillota bacterium]|nr:TetR/AcrR family transcriptional regulator [Bacillota bacterium]